MDPNTKLINFDRQVKLAKVVTEFTRYQQPYNLAILQDVQNWLTNVLAEKGSGSLDALYRRSRKSVDGADSRRRHG
jgi:son of sevenless-like protein